MWIDDRDGWRDESTEGPYDTLKTMGEWQIFRKEGSGPYELTKRASQFKRVFVTIELAKAWVNNREPKVAATHPEYNLGEERREAVRLLRRIVRARDVSKVDMYAVISIAESWLGQHDEMLPEGTEG